MKENAVSLGMNNNSFRELTYEESFEVNGGIAPLLIAGIVVGCVVIVAFAYGCYVGYQEEARNSKNRH